MTADQLNKMQQESRKRYSVPEEKPKTMAEILNENFDFIDGELILKQRYKKRQEKKLLPDLMAAQISVSSPSEKKQEEIMPTNIPKEFAESMFSKPYVPKPVQEKKRPYVHFKALSPDPPKHMEERPPAVYSNSKSYYGIYDELKEEWNKKTG